MNELVAQRPPRILNDIVFLQTELEYFFANAIMPLHFNNIVINFLDYFPMLKQGYALTRTVREVMRMYAITRDLESIYEFRPDELMMAAFNGNIPAYKYKWGNPGITMQDAVKRGLTPIYLNSFQVLEKEANAEGNNFNPNIVDINDLRTIILLNCVSLWNDPEFQRYIQNEDFANSLQDEHLIIDDLSYVREYMREELGERTNRMIVSSIMNILVSDGYLNYPIDRPDIQLAKKQFTLLKRLLADPRITVNKLMYTISSGDPALVAQYVKVYDSRANDYEAYHLAIQKNNPAIIDILKSNIVQRNLLEKQTFQTMMVPVGKLDVPPVDYLYGYSQSLLNK